MMGGTRMTLRSHVSKTLKDAASCSSTGSRKQSHVVKKKDRVGSTILKHSKKKLKGGMAMWYEDEIAVSKDNNTLEVIEVSESDTVSGWLDTNCYIEELVKELFPLSAEDNLTYALESKYLDGEHDHFVAFYVDVGEIFFPILLKDFHRFRNKLFITDAVIDGFFWLLNQQFRATYICFGYSSWYSRYMKPENADLNQLKRVIGNTVMNDVDVIYMPVFINNNHWLLAVIHLPEHLIEVFDSLDGKNPDLLRRFSELYGHEDMWKANNYYHDLKIQRQNDNYNCAFFTCWYAYQLATNNPITPWEDNWKKK